jgi:hypothetical protein
MYTHTDCTRRVQHAGEHGHALFDEDAGQGPTTPMRTCDASLASQVVPLLGADLEHEVDRKTTGLAFNGAFQRIYLNTGGRQ